MACVADCGWITGHTYVVYGPLLCGVRTFLFESTPVYPDPGRYWDMIERHKITQFYTAPTAIRLLMRYGDDIPAKYDTSSVKVLGSVGEPINPEAWRWYYEVVGKSKCSVVDTYWQTETGGHVVSQNFVFCFAKFRNSAKVKIPYSFFAKLIIYVSLFPATLGDEFAGYYADETR